MESVTGIHNTSGAPSFDLNVQRNVTTAVGQTAFLHCRVHHMGDKEVKNFNFDFSFYFFFRLLISRYLICFEGCGFQIIFLCTLFLNSVYLKKTLTALTRDEGFVVFVSPLRCLAVFRLDPLIEYACGLVKELNGLKSTMNSVRNKFLNLFCHPVLCMKQKFSITSLYRRLVLYLPRILEE